MPAIALQVYEVAGSVDAALVWNEAAMLRSCTHPRILPLYGISVEVRTHLPALLALLANLHHTRLCAYCARPGASPAAPLLLHTCCCQAWAALRPLPHTQLPPCAPPGTE